MSKYFDSLMGARQRLLWAIATRRQLERWEPFVAAAVRGDFNGPQLPSADIWTAAMEHHFALVAARNLLRALELDPPSSVEVDAVMRAELIEGRDLHEHWPENMPLFNTTPRPSEPKHRSGREFAARNPRGGPYDWLAWGNHTGARLLPNVTAPGLHRLLDDVEADVLEASPSLLEFVPPRAVSPWLHQDGEWWPTGLSSTSGWSSISP
jgi:hypothetical protein